MNLTLKEIAAAVSGTLLFGNPMLVIGGFSIDTRSLRTGDFFVPLQGDKTDGHEYIDSAFTKGACATFISHTKYEEGTHPDKAVILVEDTLKALQDVAAYHRGKFSGPLVAVTGSAGKTTTKDFIASVLMEGYHTLKTEGNLNNEIGLPLMLLKLRPDHEAAVFELGMSGFGEIALLTRLCKPDIGVITNIGEAHLEMVGSLEGVARAKGELLEEMKTTGKAVLNGEDERVLALGRSFPGETIFYGFRERYPVKGENLFFAADKTEFELTLPAGQVKIRLPQPGRHIILNALAAAAVGHLLGLTPAQIKAGLTKADVTLGRLQVKHLASLTVIDDTYNANPTSMRASLEVLVQVSGGARRGAVLGDMFELGDTMNLCHEDIGRFAARQGLAYLITLGNLSFHMAKGAREEGMETVVACHDPHEALKALSRLARKGDVLLVKGSRGMKMEKIVEEIGGVFSPQEESIHEQT